VTAAAAAVHKTAVFLMVGGCLTRVQQQDHSWRQSSFKANHVLQGAHCNILKVSRPTKMTSATCWGREGGAPLQNLLQTTLTNPLNHTRRSVRSCSCSQALREQLRALHQPDSFAAQSVDSTSATAIAVGARSR
jgi:hypothetical protein